MHMQVTPSHHIVVVGGGVAGLEIASSLGRRSQRQGRLRGLSITLIDRDSSHVWKPMLHTIAAGTQDLASQQIAYAFQARQSSFVYQPGALSHIDRNLRYVSLAPLNADDGRLLLPARKIPYDTLVLAIGSQAHDFGTPGVADHCWKIDSRQQASEFNNEVRTRLLQCLGNDAALDIAIVGGGATGVELAAELVKLVELSAMYGASGLSDRISITLVESGGRLLSSFPEDISSATRERLESLGIRVLLGARVISADASGLLLQNNYRVQSSLMVWAAGIKGPDTLQALDGLELSSRNQLVVTPTLQTSRDTNIFAIGDCSSLISGEVARPLPPTAQVAHQQAKHLIDHLPGRILHGRTIPPFSYRDFGALVSLSSYDAYGSLGKIGLFKGTTIKGRLAQLSHAMLYRAHQSRIHGPLRGTLLWFNDRIGSLVRPSIRLD